MLDRILSQAKRALSNLKYGLMRAVGRFDFIQPLMVRLHHQQFVNPSNHTDSIFPKLNIDEIVGSIRNDGYYLGIKMPDYLVREILDFASSSICYANSHVEKGFSYKDRMEVLKENPAFLLCSFYNLSILLPVVKIIEEDPQILEIAARYLESKPILQSTKMWWSFAVESSEQDRHNAAQMYHTDLDDYRFLKFFFYLTDVDENSGPHAIVRGTHKYKKFTHLIMRRFSDSEIIDEYGAGNIRTICGAAGYGFIEDARCLHKGSPPHTKDRLLFQVEFGLRDYGVSHTNVDPAKLKQINLPILS
jgi:hypothetical protein